MCFNPSFTWPNIKKKKKIIKCPSLKSSDQRAKGWSKSRWIKTTFLREHSLLTICCSGHLDKWALLVSGKKDKIIVEFKITNVPKLLFNQATTFTNSLFFSFNLKQSNLHDHFPHPFYLAFSQDPCACIFSILKGSDRSSERFLSPKSVLLYARGRSSTHDSDWGSYEQEENDISKWLRKLFFHWSNIV